MNLLSAFVSIWALTTVGYAARRGGLLGDGAASVLGRYVFYLAMPAALFLAMSSTSVQSFSWRGLAPFAISTAVVLGVSWLWVSRRFDRKTPDRPIWGMAAGYVNSANLGIPIAKEVLGNISFLAEVVLFQTLVVTPLILIALDRHNDASGRVQIRRIASLPLRNPVILASVLGLFWSIARLPVPSQVGGTLSLLSAAAVPTALVALGASLHVTRGLTAPLSEVAAITTLKLIAQPVVAAVAGLALHLSRPQLLAVMLIAGLPAAQNTFIFAQQYGAAEALAGRAVVTTTAFSLVTLAAIAALISHP